MSRRPQSTPSPPTLAARIVVCGAVALTLAGCGAGQVAQTASQVAAVDGANGDLDALALRDVLLPYPEDRNGTYPAGSNVPVQLTIVNQTARTDTLVSVSTPAAPRVLVQGTTAIPAGRSVSGDTGPSLPISPLDKGRLRIELLDTTRALRPGLNIELTFVFQDAGAVTLSVPMGPPGESERLPLEGGGH